MIASKRSVTLFSVMFLVVILLINGKYAPFDVRASETVEVGAPCSFKFPVESVNSTKEHGNGNLHGGAIDLGITMPSANGRNKEHQICNDKRMFASISGKLTVGTGFTPNTVYITNEQTRIRVVYGHLESYNPDLVNQYVQIGQEIGVMGVYPVTQFRHLHFQVHQCSQPNCSDFNIDNELTHDQWVFSENTPYLRNGSMIYAYKNDSPWPHIDIREEPGGPVLGHANWGSVGIITGGPIEAPDDNGQQRIWWKVDWGNPIIYDGWVVKEHLVKVPPLFPDVSQTNVFYYYIQLLKLAGVIDGFSDGSYRPDELVRREQMAKFIANSLVEADSDIDSIAECVADNPTSEFPDVSNQNIYYDYIMCLKGLGIISGYSDGTYRPNEPVTRGQMSKFVANALVEADVIASVGVCMAQYPTTAFPDVSVNNVFYEYVMCLKGLGIVTGYSDGTFRPDLNVERSQMAKFIGNTDNSLLAHSENYPQYLSQDEEMNVLEVAITNNTVTDLFVARATNSPDEVYWVTTDEDFFLVADEKDIPDGSYHEAISGTSPSSVDGVGDNVWIGTSNGVYMFNDGFWQHYTVQDGLPSNNVVDLSVASSGEVWVATQEGLSCYDGNVWTLYPYSLRAVAAQTNGRLWGVTSNNLFGYLDATGWHTISAVSPTTIVNSIDILANTAALGTNLGLITYDGIELSEILEPRYSIESVTYDSNGNLWTVMQDGAVLVLPGIHKTYLPVVLSSTNAQPHSSNILTSTTAICPPAEQNVALFRPTTSSSGSHPDYAVDGIRSTDWNAGNFVPQWIEINLESPTTITHIRLEASQTPPGETTHQVFVKRLGGEYELLHEFNEYTSNRSFLTYTLPTPLEDVMFVKVKTVQSPSWVAWYEVEVYSPTNP